MSKLIKLFEPIRIGRVDLAHRVVLAPLTRLRANAAHVHGDLAVTYYGQRASVPGTLLVTEATFIAAEAGGLPHAPGIWSDEQIKAWKRVTSAVHQRDSFIYLQLWALGRQADAKILEKEGNFPYVSSSDVPIKGKKSSPRALSEEEVQKYIGLYAQAAENAIEAGFDGVEIHGANGYLIDQFTQDVCNRRTDRYGGSVENRSRFALEVTKAVTDVVGEDRTGIRLSPWSEYGDMRESDPKTTFAYLIRELHDRFPALAYLHLIEPRIRGDNDAKTKDNGSQQEDSNEFAREFGPETAKNTVAEKGGLVAFGRWFISNPDLPKRIKLGAPLNDYNRKTFYKIESPEGYIDYPFLDESSQSKP